MRNLIQKPWIFSFAAAAAVWGIAVFLAHGQDAGAMAASALALAVFMVIVGIGQMTVITLGPGNIDLSLGANIGLASAVAMTVMNGEDRLVMVGFAAALSCGAAAGLANYLLIRLLRIPPIIATLSASFIIQSIDIAYGRGLQIKPPPGFANLANTQVLGVPVLALFAVAVTVIAAVVLHRTIFGRAVQAVGQNPRAARLSGFHVEAARCLTYGFSGLLAGLDGTLLAGYFQGANVDIGNDYLLASLAVAVLGGTSVSGGKPVVPGLWGAALFLVLLVTVLNSLSFSPGIRMILSGAAIVVAVTLAGGRRQAA